MTGARPRWHTLLAELKRRKVFRVAAVYGATAFVILQAVDLLFPPLGLPTWTVTLVVVLALIGFPLALALAWAFESGPEGVRRTEPAGTGEIEAIATQPRSRRWPAGLAALAGAALLGAGAWWTLGRGAEAARYDSIAVLPFANLSGDPENEYFGDGLAEELLNALAGIEGLKVAARTSAFAFKDKDIDVRSIADTLGVATVLEGSVRRSLDRLRITAQLVDARTGYHLWSDTYDRPLTDLFAVQDAIASEIVEALAIQLGGEAADGLYRGGTTNVEAYDLYLLGRQKWATRQIPLLREAITHFEAAIAHDSTFALAWSGLADAIDALAWRSPVARPRVSEAKYAAQRAILLDPALAEAWASLGVLALDFDRDWRFAELALRRAVALKPAYAPANVWLGDVLRWSGRLAESLAPAQRAIELDPFSAGWDGHGGTLSGLGRWPESRDSYLRLRHHGFRETGSALNLVTSAPWFGFTADSAALYARDWAALAGYSRPEEAAVLGRAVFVPELRGEARDVVERMEAEGLKARELGELSLALGDVDRAVQLLQRALEQGEPDMVILSFKPVYDAIRTDPRFAQLVEALGVANCGPECRMRRAAPRAGRRGRSAVDLGESGRGRARDGARRHVAGRGSLPPQRRPRAPQRGTGVPRRAASEALAPRLGTREPGP